MTLSIRIVTTDINMIQYVSTRVACTKHYVFFLTIYDTKPVKCVNRFSTSLIKNVAERRWMALATPGMLGARIREARIQRGLSQQELAEAIGFSRPAVNSWEHGRSEPSFETLQKIATVLGKPLTWFLGSEEGDKDLRHEVERKLRAEIFSGMGMKLLPVVGTIQAGIPLLAEQNIVEWLPVPRELADQADFIVKVQGDSMVGVNIHDGDYVLLRRVERQDQVKSGDIVAALVNGESTLKLLIYRGGRWYLEAANPAYDPLPVSEDVDIQVQGVFVALYTRRLAPRLPPPAGTAAPQTTEELIRELAEREGIDAAALRAFIQALRHKPG
nr:MAG: hypothetical protein DIU70_03370 [Bacillota bacterium]